MKATDMRQDLWIQKTHLFGKDEYICTACRAVCDVLESEKQGKPKSRKLMDKLNEIFDAYSEYETLHGSMDTGWFVF